MVVSAPRVGLLVPLAALSAADAWSRSHGYPVFVAGFGEDHEMAPYMRARAAGIVREAAERYGMGWAYWDLGSTFGLHDPGRERYAPEMLRALLRTH